VNLEKEMCGYDAGYVKGKVILWMDTGDILCFMIQHFKARNSSKNEQTCSCYLQHWHRQMYK